MASARWDARTLRGWWWQRQGLDGSLAGQAPAAALERAGWARSVGGAAPYLTLFARCGATREDIDRDASALALHELPSARGCTYVVPRRDFALALAVGQPFAEADLRVARKLGVTDQEIDRLCDAILTALGNGPLDPDELREACGGKARSLGEEGKKKGIGTTLPLALGRLQPRGEIRRIPTNGRLDQQRYRYTLWRPNPLAQCRLSADEAAVELARLYWNWIGPASLSEFQWFSGLSGKAARQATAPLALEPLVDDLLIAPEARRELAAFRPPAKPDYALVSSLDGLVLLRRNLASLLDAELDAGELNGLTDLPSHAIVDRGRIVGLWEFDPAAGNIAWTSFQKPDTKLREAVARMETFIRGQLGDARSFSLDSPAKRAPRIQALRRRQAQTFGNS